MKPIKIQFFINSLSGGGAERTCCDIASGLSARGHDVKVVTIGNNAPDYSLSKDVEVEFLLNRNDHDLGFFSKISDLVLLPKKLYRLVTKNRADIVISNLFRANLINCIASKLYKFPPVLLVEHCVPTQAHINSPINLSLIKLLYPISNRIICVSNTVKDDLVTNCLLSSEKLQVIYNPVKIIPISGEKIDKKFEDFYSSHEFLISWAGRMIPLKNLIHLLRACKILIDKGLSIGLILIGNGTQVEIIKSETRKLNISSHVFFSGWLKDPQNIISRSNIFTLPSFHESFGNSLVEAASLGIPVCGSNISAMKELSENGKFFPLFDPYDYNSIANILSAMIKNYGEVKKHQQETRKYFLNQFSLERILDQWEQTIIDILYPETIT